MRSDSELNKFLYCCLNLLMIAVGTALSRRIFAVFDGLGVAFYLSHLSHIIFKDSMLFPVALTALSGSPSLPLGSTGNATRKALAIGSAPFFLGVREPIAHRAE